MASEPSMPNPHEMATCAQQILGSLSGVLAALAELHMMNWDECDHAELEPAIAAAQKDCVNALYNMRDLLGLDPDMHVGAMVVACSRWYADEMKKKGRPDDAA